MSCNKPKISSENPKVVIYTKNGQVDFKAIIPDYAVLANAMERRESWYDLMYPKNQTYEAIAGKKRKNPFVYDTGNKNKKTRYE